ncbi:hypothetical protein KGF57_002790 [Candida theae]|uniref:Zn(2)-C6 fungal-type domain-containing protein n=1 Tax=Candida theae TaxID=1198502 RepID=A0AAD5BE64_9ASCO|nr:uncharacterized protein KGF57_002790 [Candida theae]KAI5957982.1 hypothetical protein KGF57_002790 [Candida theae]
MTKEKRTKPCCNCKRSKVKCVYEGSLPCERCLKTGQSATCQFVHKLPSLKLPSLESKDPALPPVAPISLNSINVMGAQKSQAPSMSALLPSRSAFAPPPFKDRLSPIPSANHLQPRSNRDAQWKTDIEQRLNSFDSKIDSLVNLLKSNQQQTNGEWDRTSPSAQVHSQTHQYYYPRELRESSNESRYLHPSSSNSFDHDTKRQRLDNYRRDDEDDITRHSKSSPPPQDFRAGFLSKTEAKDLFKFFDSNIAQQLFGFEISKFKVDDIWETCPVLVCAISTIASIHHPQLSHKSSQLQVYLRDICGTLFYQNRPTDKTGAFNTIVALILCSFWLSDSQMFTGLALQIAKEYGLNNPKYGKNKDDLKLWYLLYVLDGQQSMAFNRQPLVSSQEYSLKHSRELLINEDEKKISQAKKQLEQKIERNTIVSDTVADEKEHQILLKQKFTDLRLVSQVEYNQALSEAFRGDAWDLLMPSTFGIPSKSNLELDKWMVSWTVLLAPGNYGAVWSTKSTLIYYNFAKMHINSTAVRQLAMSPNHDGLFPAWDKSIEKTAFQTRKKVQQQDGEEEEEEEELDSEDDSDSDSLHDEDDFISNKELVSPDKAAINASIALNAAHTVINLVINDKDILDNLKYVPVHIHIMLYYAALLLINPPSKSNNVSVTLTKEIYYDKLLDNLRTVSLLKKKIYSNLPIDSNFGSRFIKSLENLEQEKVVEIKDFMHSIQDQELRFAFEKKVNAFVETSDNIVELSEFSESGESSRASTPRAEKISAWPGSHHGHP